MYFLLKLIKKNIMGRLRCPSGLYPSQACSIQAIKAEILN